MTYQEALKKLNIEDYSQRIFNSSSTGELFFLNDYIEIASTIGDDVEWFRPWFIEVVEWAEKNWKRPESIFQHILKMLNVARSQAIAKTLNQ